LHYRRGFKAEGALRNQHSTNLSLHCFENCPVMAQALET